MVNPNDIREILFSISNKQIIPSFGKLNKNQIACGELLIKEAGGKINKIDSSQINKIKISAASNIIYEKMLEKLNNF